MRPERDPDPDWVAALSGRDPTDCLRRIEEAQRETQLFAHLRREHEREGRESYIEIDAPLEIYAIGRLLRPEHVVEVGVSSGVSSAYLLRALERNGLGTLHSVDLPSRPRRPGGPERPGGASWSLPPGRASGWAVPFPLRKRWDLRLGDKADVLPLLARELPRIDLLVYDVPHDDRTSRGEFRGLDPLVRAGGVAIVDHGPRGGLCPALKGWAQDRGARAVRRRGLGLYGMRARRRPRSARPAAAPRGFRPAAPGP
ncbi:MAG TPA: class I SAM-dependent methyltransferase [Thermoplasmata archaeon]|nr:class I SAM-dependent methyltransferase [Thermoplasmata archaeon]HUI38363.1 class I SAM-dependent methyltransferase [Thermoplasmata archaeon]